MALLYKYGFKTPISTLLLTVCGTTIASAANLPDISPGQIAQDVERIYNSQTGQTEYIARDFDPFEADETVAGSARLRSAQNATTLDGHYVTGGAFLDVTTSYVTDSPDSYDVRGFERAVFLSGQPVSFVSYGNSLLNCSKDTKTVIYDDGYYNGASYGYLGGLYRAYPHYRGFTNYGWSYAPRYGGGYSSFFSYPQYYYGGYDRSRYRDRDRDRDRNHVRDGNGGIPRLTNPTPRLTSVPRIHTPTHRETPYVEPRAENHEEQEGRARQQREEVKRRLIQQNMTTSSRGVRRVISPNGGKSYTQPASTPKTPVKRRESFRSEPRATNATSRSSRSSSSQSSSSWSSSSRSRAVSRATDKNFNSRNSSRTSPKNRNFFPMVGGYSRTNTYVDYRCLKEEKLTIHIPQDRLDAARFDGFAIILIDNAGREVPVFVPPNYVEGYRQAVGRTYVAPQPQPYQGSSSREPIIYGGYPPSGG